MPQSLKYHLTQEQISAEWRLVEAAKANPKAFEPLYKTYYPRIMQFVYQRIDNKELAYEITSEVFYAALKNLSKYKSQHIPFGAWLFRIALNKLHETFRKKNSQRTINLDNEGLGALKNEIEINENMPADKKLFAALDLLKEDEMELIEMRFFENRSFKDICDITGLGESACKMRIYRILEQLKKELEKNN